MARRNPLLNGLRPQSLSAFLKDASLVRLKHHQVLYRADTDIKAVYFPLDCVVSILAEAERTSPEIDKIVMDPKSWTQKLPFLRWSAALKMKENQCHERVRATHPV